MTDTSPQPTKTCLLKPNTRAYKAYKRVYQYIHARQLKADDRLPAHQHLARELRVSNDTLSAAMQELVRHGVLKRKTRLGTVIADPTAVAPVVWTVGMLMFPTLAPHLSLFWAELSARLQVGIAQRGWRCITYYRFNTSTPARIEDFGPLEEDLEAETLDGLLSLALLSDADWARIRRQGVAACHTPIDETAPRGVVIDNPTMVRDAMTTLAMRGCHHLAVIANEPWDNTPEPTQQAFTAALAQLNGASVTPDWLAAEPTPTAARAVVENLRRRPASRRPEGLIVLDDYLAMALTNRLAEQDDYRPEIAVRTHRQLPLTYVLPVIRFELDIDKLVEAALNMLEAQLINPRLPDDCRGIPPRLASGAPRQEPIVVPTR